MFVYGTFDRAGDGERHAAGRRRRRRHRLRQVRRGRDQHRDAADRDLAHQRRPGEEEPRSWRSRRADSFDDVKAAAQDAVGRGARRRVEVEGATADQLTTLYSNLYRLYLYPNSGVREHRHRGQAALPVRVSPVTGGPAATPTQTGAPVVDGKVYVNNGFWDTYRTTWPAYSLLTPTKAGEMIDGFVQQYRDGGWIARWSSPGYANLMTGTSSDVAFADAYRQGRRPARRAGDVRRGAARTRPCARRPEQLERRPQGHRAVDLPRLHADRPPARACRGRWRATSTTTASPTWRPSWPRWARASSTPPRPAATTTEAAYFRNRAPGLRQHVRPGKVGFFQGRNADGTPSQTPEQFDPRVWGDDYTETNGWNFAFHAPQDGEGLANLYGGRDGLAQKLDAFFATPETATLPGALRRHHPRDARGARRADGSVRA